MHKPRPLVVYGRVVYLAGCVAVITTAAVLSARASQPTTQRPTRLVDIRVEPCERAHESARREPCRREHVDAPRFEPGVVR